MTGKIYDRPALAKQQCLLNRIMHPFPVTVLLAFFLLSVNLKGQPLLVEDFNYTVGTAITANGWASHSSGGTNPIMVTTSSITYPGYLSSGLGAEISMATSGEDDNRTYTAQTSGTIFYSFLVNVSSANTVGDYFFNLGASPITTTFKGRVFVKRDASNNLSFGISQGTTSANYSSASYALNTTYLIAVKFDIVPGTLNDVAAIYINPPLNAVIPASGWIQNTDGAGTDLANLGSVALRQGTAANAAALKLDGLRISTSWADIVGPAETANLVATPNTLNGFSYLEGAGPSASNSYSLSGSFLTGAPGVIAVTGPADFEVSLDNSNFYPSVDVPFASATLNPTPVHVRLKSGLSLGYYSNELITNVGGGASTVNVTCNGAVVLPEPTNYPTDFAVDTAAQLYITLTWTDAAGTPPPTGYLIKGVTGYIESAIIPPTDFVPESDGLLVKNVAQGVQTVTFTGLDPRTYYTFKIYPYTNSGIFIDYKNSSDVPVITTQTDYLTFLSAASGNWNAPSTWLIGVTGGGTVPNTQNLIPVYPTADVIIVDNYEIIVPVGYSSGKVKNLTIFSGSVKANSSSGSCYLYVYGDINNNGVIGGPTDVLGLDIEGSVCQVFGNGSLIVSRLAKYTTYTSQTWLVFYRSLTLTYSHATNPALWNQNPATTTFDIQFYPGSAVTVSNANVDMNGVHFICDRGASFILKSVSGTGTITFWIDIAPWADATHGWHLLSSPVASQTIAPMFTDAVPENYDFFKWDEVSDTWLNQKVGENNITAFEPGLGYLVAYQNNPGRHFDGTLNASDVTVSNLTNSGGTYSGWNLLGNPFHSALKWNDGVTWTVPAQFAATAKCWNEPTAAYVDIAPGSNIPNNNGFMVQVISGSPASLTIPAAARVHDFLNLYKSDPGYLKLVAYDRTGNTAQECIIAAHESATGDFDRDFDSRFLAGYAPQFYAIAGDEKLSTDVVAEIGGSTVIELGFVKNTQSQFSIGLDPESMMPGVTVFLTDKKTGAVTELKENAEYAFSSEEGDDPNRFLLHFSMLGVEEPANTGMVDVYSYTGNIFINSGMDEEADVAISNLLGQVVLQGRAKENSMTMLNGSTLPAGVYMVKVSSARTVTAKKILINQ